MTVGQRTGTRRTIHEGALPGGIGVVSPWRVLQRAEVAACLGAVFTLGARLLGFLVVLLVSLLFGVE